LPLTSSSTAEGGGERVSGAEGVCVGGVGVPWEVPAMASNSFFASGTCHKSHVTNTMQQVGH
jgi:hypothetical protein